MSIKDTFCTSPWIHMRIAHNGQYQFCRWQKTAEPPYDFSTNIKNVTPDAFWNHHMREIRESMLKGESVSQCSQCHRMEKHGMPSGRQKQLLKCGIQLDNFERTVQSSPIYDNLIKSNDRQGSTAMKPIDWQIDTGNYCNGGCIFCSPYWSSSLAKEFKQNGLIDELPMKSWADDPALVDRLVTSLEKTEHLHYLHFLGGETVITPAFKIILKRLVQAEISSRVTVGFTTNLMMWDKKIIKLLSKFKHVIVNCSIECINPLNDYLRYPSKLDSVMNTLESWRIMARRYQWDIKIRATVSNISVFHLDTLYDYCFKNKLTVECCHFLEYPEHMQISTLPQKYRQIALKKLKAFVNKHDKKQVNVAKINIQNQATVEQQIISDCISYINYLESEPDRSELLPKLTDYLMTLEKNPRRGSILEYIPEYEELLRDNGYTPQP